ncbi:MAG TPA: thiamine-phosphate kinase [bacterium]|nr:thiamine-phosphate kinase [bacterium]
MYDGGKMLNNKEWELINIAAGKDNLHIGDDCAVWDEKNLVVTTDHMCENIHFDFSFMTPESVGWRLMAANASDIISMGSKPTHFLLNIAVPSSEMEIAKKIISGIKSFAGKYNIKIMGGDTTGSQFFMVGATMFGEKPEKPLLRSGAKPGDFVYISSPTGLSKCGLLHLQYSTNGFELSKKKFLYPDPFETVPSSFECMSSAIDISDSLISELILLAKSSKVHIKIDLDKIPIEKEVEQTAKLFKMNVEELVLGSGEEFSLIFTSDREIKQGYKIGRVYETKEPEVEVFNKNGVFDLSRIAVFTHFG